MGAEPLTDADVARLKAARTNVVVSLMGSTVTMPDADLERLVADLALMGAVYAAHLQHRREGKSPSIPTPGAKP